jgi:site-specific DNA recombinase
VSAKHFSNGRSLRFALLVRVSTERQEKQGESLQNQRKFNARDLDALGGTLAGWYGGQEHATPKYEKKEVARLLADARNGRFDAVLVAFPDRWSKDNSESKQGLEIFRQHGVRFFVGTREYNLFDPNVRLLLGMSAEIGEFLALQQNLKSIQTRIERAKAGIPTVGKVPYARIFDKRTGLWSVDEVKRRQLEQAAHDYLDGRASLPELARRIGTNYANLCKILRGACGPTWTIHFDDDRLNVHEEVTLTIPALLDDGLIGKVKARLKANRTHLNGHPKHDYLLAGYVFCAECNYSLFGEWVDRGHGTPQSYYRHCHSERARDCPLTPRPWVNATKLEAEVTSQLFDLLGNPALMERSVRQAAPDLDAERERLDRLTTEIARVARGRQRILALVAEGDVSEGEASEQLKDLKSRESKLKEEAATLQNLLADAPDPHAIRVYIERLGDTITLMDDSGLEGHLPGGNDVSTWLRMTREDKRAMVRAAFHQPLADGTPAGVYVRPTGPARKYRPRSYEFTLRGQMDFEFVMQNLNRRYGTGRAGSGGR